MASTFKIIQAGKVEKLYLDMYVSRNQISFKTVDKDGNEIKSDAYFIISFSFASNNNPCIGQSITMSYYANETPEKMNIGYNGYKILTGTSFTPSDLDCSGEFQIPITLILFTFNGTSNTYELRIL